MRGRRRDEPEERRDHAQREHREDPGLAVVVRAGDHERARHQSDRGRRLLVMLHGDAEQLPLRDQHDESGHDARTRPCRSSGCPARRRRARCRSGTRPARRARPRSGRAGRDPLPPPPRSAPASWGRPAPRSPRPPSAARRRPRRGPTGCRPRPRRRGCRRTGRRPTSGLGDAHDALVRLVVERIVHVDRTGEVLGRGLDVLRRRGLVVAHGQVVTAEPPAADASGTSNKPPWSVSASVDSGGGREVVADVLVLDRLPHQLVDGLEHAGVVPGVLVVFVIDRRTGSQMRGIRLVGDHDRLALRRTDGDVLLLRACRRAGVDSSDSQSTSRMGAKNLSRSSNRSSPPGLSSATRPP